MNKRYIDRIDIKVIKCAMQYYLLNHLIEKYDISESETSESLEFVKTYSKIIDLSKIYKV